MRQQFECINSLRVRSGRNFDTSSLRSFIILTHSSSSFTPRLPPPIPLPPLATLVAVIENLNLYAGKDEECFAPFLGNFTETIWKLLLEIKPTPGRDELCCTSLKFLTALISRSINASIFEKALDDIISKVVIPNVAIREADVEMFEDDPDEFILRDMEGGEGDSRRRCGVDLLRGMCRGWEER